VHHPQVTSAKQLSYLWCSQKVIERTSDAAVCSTVSAHQHAGFFMTRALFNLMNPPPPPRAMMHLACPHPQSAASFNLI
jgi:hypothetical protein